MREGLQDQVQPSTLIYDKGSYGNFSGFCALLMRRDAIVRVYLSRSRVCFFSIAVFTATWTRTVSMSR